MNNYRLDLTFDVDQRQGIDLSGFSKIFSFSYPAWPENKKQWMQLAPSDSVQIVFEVGDSIVNLNLLRDGKLVETINLNSIINRLKNTSDENKVPLKDMIVDGNGNMMPRLIIQSIRIKNAGFHDEEKIFKKMEGWIMIK